MPREPRILPWSLRNDGVVAAGDHLDEALRRDVPPVLLGRHLGERSRPRWPGAHTHTRARSSLPPCPRPQVNRPSLVHRGGVTAPAVAPVCLSQPYDDWTAEFASEAWSAVADSSAELTSFYITLSDSDDSTCAHPHNLSVATESKVGRGFQGRPSSSESWVGGAVTWRGVLLRRRRGAFVERCCDTAVMRL